MKKLVYMTSILRDRGCGRVEIVHQPVPGCTLSEDPEAPYSDEHIEHWGRVYEARDIYRRFGIEFWAFLLDPQHLLEVLAARPADAPPLLPRQARVMTRLLEWEVAARRQAPPPNPIARLIERAEAELDRRHAEWRGDRYVEPLRHHAYGVSQARTRRATA